MYYTDKYQQHLRTLKNQALQEKQRKRRQREENFIDLVDRFLKNGASIS